MNAFISKIHRISFRIFIGSTCMLSSLCASAEPIDRFSKETAICLIAARTNAIFSSNAAVERIETLNRLLTENLSRKDRLKFSKELFGILAGTPATVKRYGPLSEPITGVSLNDFPLSSGIPIVYPEQTAWLKESGSFFPTNDWFEQLAVYPRSLSSESTGFYRVAYSPDGSVNYSSPLKFVDHEEVGQSENFSVESVDDKGFILGSLNPLNPHPFVKWIERRVGNMVRHLVYQNMTFYVAQGSVLKGVYYRNDLPSVGLENHDKKAKYSKKILKDGTQKYRIKTSDRIYLFYGNENLDLRFDSDTCRFHAKEEYTGLINACSIPNALRSRKTEKLIDRYADVVVVRGQGSPLPDGNYEFAYMCHDLHGSPTEKNPLIFLKEHHVETLVDTGTAEKKEFQEIGLQGILQAYEGSAFLFRESAFIGDLNPIPDLPNGMKGIMQSQAQDVVYSGRLDRAVAEAYHFQPALDTNERGKGIYQIALTLACAKEVMEIANVQKTGIIGKLHPLYVKLTSLLTEMWGNLERDASWGIIVPKATSIEKALYFNDSIALKGNLIFSLALIADFENAYFPPNLRFLEQNIPLLGYEKYTNRDMGNFLAADIGETGNSPDHPRYRHFDIYNGYSWLSGLDRSDAGNRAESQSDFVFGSMAVCAWLNRINPGSVQAQLARTRWAVETRALKTYFHIGEPKESVYQNVSARFSKKRTALSVVRNDRFESEDPIGSIVSQTTPVSALLMDNFLNGDLSFAKRAAEVIIQKWHDPDLTDPQRSLLIQTLARIRPAQAQMFILELERKGSASFDSGTNAFLLYLMTLYAANEKLFD